MTNSETYNTLLGDAAEKIQKEIEGVPMWMLGSDAGGKMRDGMEDVDYSLWGVGNHGGGASRKDLAEIAEFQKEMQAEGGRRRNYT